MAEKKKNDVITGENADLEAQADALLAAADELSAPTFFASFRIVSITFSKCSNSFFICPPPQAAKLSKKHKPSKHDTATNNDFLFIPSSRFFII